jgi:hypothetical protein
MKRLLTALALIAGVVSLHAQVPAARTLRVLIVGNSYTYFNNLGDMLTGIAASLPGPRIETTMHVEGGMTLQWHWAAGKAQKAIDQKAWDYVILQEQSALGGASINLATDDPAAGGRGESQLSPPTIFHESVRKFVPYIRAHGSTPVLLMTWARRSRPEEQAALTGATESIARELKVDIAPVGAAWQETRKRWPEIELYVADGSHPSEAGTYLAASVLYAFLTRRSPVGAATTITGHPYARLEGTVDLAQTVALATLAPGIATKLQAVAWEIGRGRR